MTGEGGDYKRSKTELRAIRLQPQKGGAEHEHTFWDSTAKHFKMMEKVANRGKKSRNKKTNYITWGTTKTTRGKKKLKRGKREILRRPGSLSAKKKGLWEEILANTLGAKRGVGRFKEGKRKGNNLVGKESQRVTGTIVKEPPKNRAMPKKGNRRTLGRTEQVALIFGKEGVVGEKIPLVTMTGKVHSQ